MFKNITVIIKKELSTYFKSPIAYIFILVFLSILNWLFFQDFFLRGEVIIKPYFDLFPLMFLFLIPAISMRLLAEEKAQKTEEVLLTLPTSDMEIILGKFFGGLALLIICLGYSLIVPITLALLGYRDAGVVFSGYLGAVLLGGVYLALGLFISSLNQNQIIVFVITLAISFLFFIIGSEYVLLSAPKIVSPLLQFIGISSHYANFTRGIIDTRDLVYLLSLILIFLLLSKINLESRLWK